MKLTLTRTFRATKTTCADLVKSGRRLGRLVKRCDLAPLWIWPYYGWIQANPRKVIYLLDDEETSETLK